MKKVISLLVVLVLSTFTTTLVYAQDVTYNFNAPCNNFTCTSPPFGITDNCHGRGTNIVSTLNTAVIASASNFNLGPGLVSSTFNCGGPMNGFASGYQNNPSRARWASNWPTVVNLNFDYFTFTLTASTFSNVQIASIAWEEQISGTGPTGREIRMSHDGFVSTFTTSVTPAASGWNTRTTNTALPSFYGSIEIRIYGYSASGSGGSLRIDNVRVYANVTNLPIELVLFEASAEIDKVRLNWTTASELNNEYFTVLRSADPSSDSWEEVARVQGAGTSQMSLDYEAFDNNPLSGISYYKLRQTDFDGTFSESPVVAVNFNQDRTRSLVLRIGNMAFLEGQTSYLIDASGKILGNQKVHTLMQAGTYFLKGEDGRVLRLLVLE